MNSSLQNLFRYLSVDLKTSIEGTVFHVMYQTRQPITYRKLISIVQQELPLIVKEIVLSLIQIIMKYPSPVKSILSNQHFSMQLQYSSFKMLSNSLIPVIFSFHISRKMRNISNFDSQVLPETLFLFYTLMKQN